jgi:hypothetical protein
VLPERAFSPFGTKILTLTKPRAKEFQVAKKLKYHTVHQIESLLKYWEDKTFAIGLLSTQSGLDDKVNVLRQRLYRSWPNFRSFILNYSGRQLTEDYFAEADKMGMPDIALMLLAWNHFSRRVYSIDESLQVLLSTTSVDGIRWEDVYFPFESFLITLPIPIPNRDGILHDSLLFLRNQPEWGDKSILILPLPMTLNGCGLSRFDKRRLLMAAHQGEFLRLADLTKEALSEKRFPRLPFVCERIDGGIMVSDTMLNPFGGATNDPILNGNNWPEWQLAIRIVVGFCMYLEHRPGAEGSDWIPVPKIRRHPDRRAISNAAQICSVASIYPVAETELRRFRESKSLYEVSAHWRAAHKRRPPGMGSDPAAEKTVKIPTVLVRRDRLEPGELPGGSKQIHK